MDKQIKLISKIFGSEIILKVILGFTSIILARYLTIDNYALFFYILTIANLSISVSSIFFNKLFFTKNNFKSINTFNKLNVIFALIIISTIIFTSIALINSIDILLFFTVINLVIVRVIYLHNQTILQRKLDFKKIYIKELLRVIFYAFPTIFYLLISNEYKIKYIFLIQVFSFSITEILFAKKHTIFFSVSEIKKVFNLFFINENKYILFYTITLMVLSSVDTLMLKMLSNDYELSNYGAAFTLYAFLMLGLSSVHKYILPKTTLSKISNFEYILKPIKKTGLIIMPLFVIGLFLSEKIFIIIYGENKFPESYIIFNILAVSAVLSFFLSPYSNLLFKTGHFKFQTITYIFGLLIFIGLNYLLIPIYGSKGAAVNTLLTFFIVNFLVYLKSKKIIKNQSLY